MNRKEIEETKAELIKILIRSDRYDGEIAGTNELKCMVNLIDKIETEDDLTGLLVLYSIAINKGYYEEITVERIG